MHIHIIIKKRLKKVINLSNFVEAPNLPSAHITGQGFLANLLRSIVNAFQPMGLQLEIDTIPCLPTPIPPDYDRYVQLGEMLE